MRALETGSVVLTRTRSDGGQFYPLGRRDRGFWIHAEMVTGASSQGQAAGGNDEPRVWVAKRERAEGPGAPCLSRPGFPRPLRVTRCQTLPTGAHLPGPERNQVKLSAP